MRPGCSKSEPQACPLPACPHHDHVHLECAIGCRARMAKNWAKLSEPLVTFFFFSAAIDDGLPLVPYVCLNPRFCIGIPKSSFFRTPDTMDTRVATRRRGLPLAPPNP